MTVNGAVLRVLTLVTYTLSLMFLLVRKSSAYIWQYCTHLAAAVMQLCSLIFLCFVLLSAICHDVKLRWRRTGSWRKVLSRFWHVCTVDMKLSRQKQQQQQQQEEMQHVECRSCQYDSKHASPSNIKHIVENEVDLRLEEHEVETEDGFLLTTFRIRKEGRCDCRRPAVLLQHGLFQTALPFVFNGRTGSLAFVLVDAGFDVWLSNTRYVMLMCSSSQMSHQHSI